MEHTLSLELVRISGKHPGTWITLCSFLYSTQSTLGAISGLQTSPEILVLVLLIETPIRTLFYSVISLYTPLPAFTRCFGKQGVVWCFFFSQKNCKLLYHVLIKLYLFSLGVAILHSVKYCKEARVCSGNRFALVW